MADHLPTTNGWLMLPFERVYAAAGHAPVRLGGVQGTPDTARVVASNPLYTWLRSVNEQRVYGLDKGYRDMWVPAGTGRSGLVPIVVFPKQTAKYSKRFDSYGIANRIVASNFPVQLQAAWTQALSSRR